MGKKDHIVIMIIIITGILHKETFSDNPVIHVNMPIVCVKVILL